MVYGGSNSGIIGELFYEPKSIKVSPKDLITGVGSVHQYTAIERNEDEPSKERDVTEEVIWESSNKYVAYIDNYGKVKTLKPGKTDIKATLPTESNGVLTDSQILLVGDFAAKITSLQSFDCNGFVHAGTGTIQ